MIEDRVIQTIATLIAVGVIVGTIRVLAHKYGGTVPGMIARMLKWAARWLTNLAIQYDVFLRNWRAYVKKNPIVMQCEDKTPASAQPPVELASFTVTKKKA